MIEEQMETTLTADQEREKPQTPSEESAASEDPTTKDPTTEEPESEAEDTANEDNRSEDENAEHPDKGNSQEEQEPQAVQEEIKIVIALKDGTGTVGVKKPDTDIFFESFQGLDMDLLLEEVPGVILNARAKWEDSPKYPAHERSRTPPTPRRQNGRQRAAAANNGNTEPETPAEDAAPAAPEAPREIQQALL